MGKDHIAGIQGLLCLPVQGNPQTLAPHLFEIVAQEMDLARARVNDAC